jgi:hypothetical protein
MGYKRSSKRFDCISKSAFTAVLEILPVVVPRISLRATSTVVDISYLV